MQSLLCNLISNPVVLALVASKAPEGWLLGLPGATWDYWGYLGLPGLPGGNQKSWNAGLLAAAGATWGYWGYLGLPGGDRTWRSELITIEDK